MYTRRELIQMRYQTNTGQAIARAESYWGASSPPTPCTHPSVDVEEHVRDLEVFPADEITRVDPIVRRVFCLNCGEYLSQEEINARGPEEPEFIARHVGESESRGLFQQQHFTWPKDGELTITYRRWFKDNDAQKRRSI